MGGLAPLKIDASQAKSTKKVSLSSLVKDMRQFCSTKSVPVVQSALTVPGDLSYIFAKPRGDESNFKEAAICDALNQIGIFQVNADILMKDYAF